MWLKNVLQIHAGLLLTNPDLPDLLGSTVGSIQNRLALYMPLNNLRGRLDLLVSQINSSSEASGENNEDEALLFYNDTGMIYFDYFLETFVNYVMFPVSDDASSDVMDVVPHSDSDNEWMEESSQDEDDDEGGEDQSDEEMSS